MNIIRRDQRIFGSYDVRNRVGLTAIITVRILRIINHRFRRWFVSKIHVHSLGRRERIVLISFIHFLHNTKGKVSEFRKEVMEIEGTDTGQSLERESKRDTKCSQLE